MSNDIIYQRPQLEILLKDSGIGFIVVEHPEVFTVEAALEHFRNNPGVFAKNLFLQDKKRKQLYLLCAKHDTITNLNAIGKALGCGSGNLRFGNEESLIQKLGVSQGSVSLFGLINDKQHDVVLLLDNSFHGLDMLDKYIYFHPLTNSASFGIKANDIEKFITVSGHRDDLKLLNISSDGLSIEVLV